jgi:hypothetical protein
MEAPARPGESDDTRSQGPEPQHVADKSPPLIHVRGQARHQCRLGEGNQGALPTPLGIESECAENGHQEQEPEGP